jgi:glutamate-1-semialdehyde aminotransferase
VVPINTFQECFHLQVARAHRIPVIYDEVFTGGWRLGLPTAGALLGAAPDIACYAKLLTGGVAPLAVTLASEEVFDAFKGPSKVRRGRTFIAELNIYTNVDIGKSLKFSMNLKVASICCQLSALCSTQ